MRTFFAAVFSVIAVGVLLIAYGLLSPRVAAAPGSTVTFDPSAAAAVQYQTARPVYASDRLVLQDDPYAAIRPPRPYAAADVRDPRGYTSYPSPAPAPTSRSVTRVERASGRDWTKTALVIGGSTATAAGLGAIFGGRKGALIGAAIGGGASTLYEARQRR
jgi:hypothetical protein